MELLPKASAKDNLHMLLAYLLVAITGALALFVVHLIRVTAIMVVPLAGWDHRGYRLVSAVSWVVLGISWAIFFMAIVDRYPDAVKQARIRRARGDAPPPSMRGGLARWLWARGLDVLARRFVYATAIPVGVGAITLLARELVLRAILS